MPLLFVKHKDAVKYEDYDGKTLNEVLEEAKKEVSDLTWEQLALYNWGTKEKREVNRAMVELMGCETVDANDPLKTKFKKTLGPSAGGAIFLPKVWVKKEVETVKEHVVKVKKRKSAPAVEITKLSNWFLPDKCEMEYRKEGLKERAEKADVEFHVDRYFELGKKGGEEIACDTTGDKDATHVYQKRDNSMVAGERATDKKETHEWDGKSKATQGILEDPKEISHHCAPYTAMVRFYSDAEDKDAKIRLKCFCPGFGLPPSTGVKPDWDKESFKVAWDIVAAKADKLKHGQLQVWDKKDKMIFCLALDETRIKAKELNLLDVGLEKGTLDRDALPYRVQIQVHSDTDEDKGLALSAMHAMVKARDYKEVEFLGFNIKPGLNSTRDKYLGDADDDTDIDERVKYMIEGIKQAHTLSKKKDDASVLKLFMGPEFYWRGEKGGYAVEKIETIATKMKAETCKSEYADWIFVLGTAIGFMENKSGGGAIKHTHNMTYQAKVHKLVLSEIEVTFETQDELPHLKETDWKIKLSSEVVALSLEKLEAQKYKAVFEAAEKVTPVQVKLEPVDSVTVTKTTPVIKDRDDLTLDVTEYCNLSKKDFDFTSLGFGDWSVKGISKTEIIKKGSNKEIIKDVRYLFQLEDRNTVFKAGDAVVLNETASKIYNTTVHQVILSEIEVTFETQDELARLDKSDWKIKLGSEVVASSIKKLNTNKYKAVFEASQKEVKQETVSLETVDRVTVTKTTPTVKERSDLVLNVTGAIDFTSLASDDWSVTEAEKPEEVVEKGSGKEVTKNVYYSCKLKDRNTPLKVDASVSLNEPLIITEVGSKSAKTPNATFRNVVAFAGQAAVLKWGLEQGSNKAKIETCKFNVDKFELTLDKDLKVGPVTLVEPVTSEVLNIALVQKGWPQPPCRGGLTQVLVYKEFVSPIDFIHKGGKDHHDPSGIGRRIWLDGKEVYVLPTIGSTDLLAKDPHDLSADGKNEINKSGLGGGSVFTMDGITFGLEVCLDHYKRRLHNYVTASKPTEKNPKIQLQLIPSWGMSITQGSIASVKDGFSFNVDGDRADSVLRINDGKYVCDKHPGEGTETYAKICAKRYAFYFCPTCNVVKDTKCSSHGGSQDVDVCQVFTEAIVTQYCTSCGTKSNNVNCCGNPTKTIRKCNTCNGLDFATSTYCQACKKSLICGRYYPSGGGCSGHQGLPWICKNEYKPIGTPIAVSTTNMILSGNWKKYFEDQQVQIAVCAAQKIPDPDVF